MEVIHCRNIYNILKRTLNCVDSRLVDHGERVAYLVLRMLQKQGCSEKELQEAICLSLLHDIGAYKTEEISKMVTFETEDVWHHSIYGALYLAMFSPLKESADAILYHHLDASLLKDTEISDKNKKLAALIHLADRCDLAMEFSMFDITYFEERKDLKFSAWAVDLLKKVLAEEDIAVSLKTKPIQEILISAIEKADMDNTEKSEYLSLIAYSIDFRSDTMVLHTMTTLSVSMAIGRLMKLSALQLEQLYYGALLHDVGKITIPIEILEKPGKLTDEQMQVMKTHAEASRRILEGYVDPVVCNIAVRHHEKLNGKGYPLGLTDKDLSITERICTISDIISALVQRRSYKSAYDLDKTKEILKAMADNNEICPVIVNQVLHHFDTLLEEAKHNSDQMLALYGQMRMLDSTVSLQIQNGCYPSIGLVHPGLYTL